MGRLRAFERLGSSTCSSVLRGGNGELRVRRVRLVEVELCLIGVEERGVRGLKVSRGGGVGIEEAHGELYGGYLRRDGRELNGLLGLGERQGGRGR